MKYRSKQVILILAHKNIQQLIKLVSYFEGKCDLFIHVDKKAKFSKEDLISLSKMPGVKKVYQRFSVSWAGFSILRCELFLLKEALKHSNGDYFHLLSGQDYPLKPLNEFLHYFHETEKAGFLSCSQLPHTQFDNGTYFRMQYYVLTDWINAKPKEGKNKVLKFIDWQRKLNFKRRIPDQIERLYGGSAWFSICRRCAEYLRDYTHEHPSFYKRLKYTFYPEEVYIASVLMNSAYAKDINNNENFRCILWNNPGKDCSPMDLTLEYLDKILKYGRTFFARKFEHPSCSSLVNAIDKYMLKEPSKGTSSTGCWLSCSFNDYDYDYGLTLGLLFLCRTLEIDSVLDLGCGPGYYVSDLQIEKIPAIGYDGNPHTSELSSLIMPKDTRYPCEEADVTEELNVSEPYDLVLFLNVGEYIPPQHEERVLNNLAACTGRYLIMNWASYKKHDERIVNAIPEETLLKKMEQHGFVLDKLATKVMRDHSRKKENKEGLLVFQVAGKAQNNVL
ncbi:MAG: hypothetical protein IJ013_05365 [Bacteroidaceae bacterium]|nr:hypothetical protein [Bacteroidaceae bacterium]